MASNNWLKYLNFLYIIRASTNQFFHKKCMETTKKMLFLVLVNIPTILGTSIKLLALTEN